MCEVKSKGKMTKNQKNNTMINNKKKDCDEPHLALNEKNVAHLVDKITNWCIGGYWFILALYA
jgi:hypothetical protein